MDKKDKNKRIYRTTGLIGLVLVAIHFVLVFSYCLSDQNLPETLRMASNEYCVPFFHQGYQLFAPDPPPYQGFLEVHCMKNGELETIIPGVSDALPEHFRLPRTADRLVIEMMADMRKNMYYAGDSLKYDVVEHGRGYLALVYMCATQYEQLHGHKPDSVQFNLDLLMIPANSDSLPSHLPYKFPWYAING